MAAYGLLIFANFLVFTASMNTADGDFRYISYHDLQLSMSRFSENGVTFYSQLLFDVARNQVLVGARDALFRLSLPTLRLLENTTWVAPSDKISLCIAKGQSEQDCHNYVKVLLTNGRKIFTCGTNAFSPVCSWREIENISQVLRWVDGTAKCPYNPLADTTAIMSENGDYYVGGPTDFHGSDAAIYRSLGEHNIRTKQYNSMWLNEPQFVGSFETDRFVYFLFREPAVEYINCGKIIYSRIARVCKNDPGGQLMLKDNWTTFVKARLNCSISGDYPAYFDEVQSMTYVAEENLVYAAFTTPSNGIAGSAICAFNLTAIDSTFSGPFKSQQHTGSSWDKHYSQHQDHFQCKPSLPHNKYLIESSKYQLMDNAVPATTLSPLHVAELERFTHLTVDVLATKLHTSVHVIFVSTQAGLIKKLTVLPGTRDTCVVEVWQPVPDVNIPILTVQYLKETDSVLVGTQNELLKVSAHHCRRHVSRESCHNAMDPYCGWHELEDACTVAPNADPLTKHWSQSVTSCPILNAAVDGGWSTWSDWAPCQFKTTHDPDSSDECLCQTRHCNNPAPQNGGKTCTGLSIAVTNCTVHGGWTPWSSWSACSATCGVAVKTRKRTCSNPSPAHGGRVCVGQDRAEVLCTENPPCPNSEPVQDGQWSEWGDWSVCTAPCGGGFRKRQRKCDSPPPASGGLECVGCDVQYEMCNMFPCPELRRHGPWTPWFLTNASKDEYVEHRYKYTCRGPVHDPSQLKITLYKEEERTCREGLCSSSNIDDLAKWSPWSSWSECSASCGDGIQMKTRTCEGRGECQGASIQTRKCNLLPCKAEWGCWTDWSPCSVSCGLGVRMRHRTCLNEGCDGESAQEESCEGPPCSSLLGWGEWTVWSLCDANNEQHRQRKCRTSNPGPHICQGSSKESRMCVSDVSNDLRPLEMEVETASASTGVVVGCLLAGIVIGLMCSGVMIYFYFRKRKPNLPSSPHYISAKQNPYITVPLQELPSKRHGASTSNSILNNSHNSTLKSNKYYNDYDTATIKRNSHGLNNGHMKSDNYFYD